MSTVCYSTSTAARNTSEHGGPPESTRHLLISYKSEIERWAVTQLVQQSIDGGQIEAGLSPTMVTGLLSGAVLYEAMARRDGVSVSTPSDDYAEQLVDLALQRARAEYSVIRDAPASQYRARRQPRRGNRS